MGWGGEKPSYLVSLFSTDAPVLLLLLSPRTKINHRLLQAHFHSWIVSLATLESLKRLSISKQPIHTASPRTLSCYRREIPGAFMNVEDFLTALLSDKLLLLLAFF